MGGEFMVVAVSGRETIATPKGFTVSLENGGGFVYGLHRLLLFRRVINLGLFVGQAVVAVLSRLLVTRGGNLWLGLSTG